MKEPASLSPAERALDEAIELTFPASDPIAPQSPVAGTGRHREGEQHASP